MDQFQQNPMHIAAASGFADLVRYFIDSGEVDLMAQDINGNTCMHMTVKAGMPRLSWLISQSTRGECVRLINIENKQHLKPYDLIKNEKGLKLVNIFI